MTAEYGVSHEETRAALREAWLLVRRLLGEGNSTETDLFAERFEARHRHTLDALDPPEPPPRPRSPEQGLSTRFYSPRQRLVVLTFDTAEDAEAWDREELAEHPGGA